MRFLFLQFEVPMAGVRNWVNKNTFNIEERYAYLESVLVFEANGKTMQGALCLHPVQFLRQNLAENKGKWPVDCFTTFDEL